MNAMTAMPVTFPANDPGVLDADGRIRFDDTTAADTSVVESVRAHLLSMHSRTHLVGSTQRQEVSP